MNNFLIILAGMSLGGSLMALALFALRPLLRKKSLHAFLYFLYIPVLLRFLLPLPGLLAVDSLYVPEGRPRPAYSEQLPLSPGTNRDETRTELPYTPVSAAETQPRSAEAIVPAGETPPAPVSELPTAAAAAAEAAAPCSLSVSSGEVLTLLWGLGAAAVFLCQLIGYARFASLLRGSARPDERASALLTALAPGGRAQVLRSLSAPSPLLLGTGRCVIVLPEGAWDDRELEDVLRHELIHCRRHDTLRKWLALCVLSLHWFNPLLWLLRRSMNRDCELSCDAAVIAPMSPREKQHYGETLIRLSARNALPAALPASALGEGKAELKTRLTEIMRHRPVSSAGICAAVLCAALLCGCGVLVGRREEQPGWLFASGDPYASAGSVYATGGAPIHLSDPDCIWNADGTTAYIQKDGDWFASSGNVFYPYYGGFATDGNVYYPDRLQPEPVTVSSVDELLRAMKSDSVIIMKSGVYDLNEAAVDFYPAAYWRPRDGEQQLRFSRLGSVRVRSESGDPADVTIIGGSESSSGLMLESCWGVNFQGITFASHGGEACFRPAVELEDCTSVYFGRCVFSDPGACLLSGGSINNLTAEDCVFAAADPSVVFYGSNYLLFQRCDFGTGSLPSFSRDCSAVLMADCRAGDRPLRAEDVGALSTGDVTFY